VYELGEGVLTSTPFVSVADAGFKSQITGEVGFFMLHLTLFHFTKPTVKAGS
jgi:hypothetical protein